MSVKYQSENPNNAASDKWRLSIGSLILFSRKIHDFSVPGIYSDGLEAPSPGNVLNSMSSDRVTFDPIVFTFVIDEDWGNWLEIFNWIISNTQKDIPREEDITIELLDNQNRPVGLKILLQEARPTSLEAAVLDADGDSHAMVTTCTFKYIKMHALFDKK